MSVCSKLNYFVPLLIAVVQLLQKKKKSWGGETQTGSFFKVKFKNVFKGGESWHCYTYCVQVGAASWAG